MAEKTLTPIKGEMNKITPFKMEQVGEEVAAFAMPCADESVVIVVEGIGELTLKAPENGSYAAAGSDETLAVNGYAQIRLESARYADNKGVVRMTGADLSVAVLY